MADGPDGQAAGRRRGARLLAAGAAVGLAAALWGALGQPGLGGPGRGAIATVEGVAIARADYERALGALAADKRSPLTTADARRALDRLVDEELLVRRGLDLGLGTSDLAVRKALIDAMVQFAVAEAAGREPNEAELRRFYAERPELVRRAPQLRVQVASFPSGDAQRVESMRTALRAGAGFEQASKSAGADPVVVPDALLPAAKLADYAGPAVRDAALALSPGEVAGPIDAGGVPTFVFLIEKRAGEVPPFDSVRATVAEEWRRRSAESALDHYLVGLRRSARIRYAADVPPASVVGQAPAAP
ncbi:MAG TPA: peptidylprolyl isomerase [Steroidobacteraceae bacterium]|nr:peptidylprolyl isomerase [Steroidobacteraceae bacterium]